MSTANAFVLFIIATVMGALIGCLVTLELARRLLPRVLPKPTEGITIDQINTIFQIRAENGRLLANSTVTTKYQELSADLVQQWLDKRGLVMAPKGKDFSVRAPS